MRRIYTAILFLLTPGVFLRLLWRGVANRGYWQRWGERFGYFPALPGPPAIWVHAVSVGEAQAAVPLIQWLLQQEPKAPIVVTTMTPTGSERVRKTLGDKVYHVYVPYDLPGAVQRFLKRVRPRLAIIMETELWPNLFHYCHLAKIPVIVANARLSPRSARGYQRWISLTRATLNNISVIAAQSPADAQRFVSLGAAPERIKVTGSIKFDVKLPGSVREQAEVLRREWGRERPVWIAASTHEGEEEQVLKAMALVRQHLPAVLLVLVPRHPERFAKVEALCRRAGYQVSLRSRDDAVTKETAIFLGDTMGELPLFYAASDVAYVGGSLVPVGGHNVLEAAALEIPALVGPHTFNFTEITDSLLQAGGARRIAHARALADAVLELLQQPELRIEMGSKGARWVADNRGALSALLAIIKEYLR